MPSSINRVYALVYPNAVNFGLNYAASFVFPLQGFWNVIVYIITSQTACRRLWHDVSAWTQERLVAHTSTNVRHRSASLASTTCHRLKSEDEVTLTGAPK